MPCMASAMPPVQLCCARTSHEWLPPLPCCRYVRRRARQGFAEAASVSDAVELQRLWEQGRQQLQVARRQSLVYDLYSRRHKHAMVRHAAVAGGAWRVGSNGRHARLAGWCGTSDCGTLVGTLVDISRLVCVPAGAAAQATPLRPSPCLHHSLFNASFLHLPFPLFAPLCLLCLLLHYTFTSSDQIECCLTHGL